MTARSGEEEWQWERKFTIEADKARALNQQDVTIDTSINWWLISSMILVAVLMGIIFYLLIQKKKISENK